MSREQHDKARTEVDIPNTVPDDVAETIKRLRRDDPDPDAQDRNRSRRVTPKRCALLRYMVEMYDTKRTVAEELEWATYRTVKRHTNGNCECDTQTHVHYDECMKMRIRAREGTRMRALARLFDVGESTVSDHVRGACDHEDGIEPVTCGSGHSPPHAAGDD